MKMLVLIFGFIAISLNAQEKLPKAINDEFGKAIIYNYFGEGGNTRLFLNQKLREKGYEPMDIDVLVESIVSNSKNRNIVLEVFYEYFGTDKEYLYYNLLSLGMSASSSKYLCEYITDQKFKIQSKK